MGTIRAQQTDNAQEAIDAAQAVSGSAGASDDVEELRVFVVDNADALIQMGAAVQRLETLLQRHFDEVDGGRLGVT